MPPISRSSPTRAFIAAAFAAAVAVSCGGKGANTGPAAVSTLSLSPSLTSLRVGETATLTATARDASGNTLTGRTATWATSSAAIASVSAAGVVTGVAAGSVVISASVESKTAQVSILVSAGGPDCSSTTPVALNPGDVRVLSGGERTTLCIAGGASGADYALIPVNLSNPRQASSVTLSSANTMASMNASLTSAVVAQAPRADPRSVLGLTAIAGAMPRDFTFESELRRRWRTESAVLRAARRAAIGSPLRTAGAPAAIRDLPATPTVGSLIQLNASSTSACTTPLLRTARVTAVSTHAIVVEDTTAPPGGFSDGEYLSIATTFDTLIFPLDTALFGAPYDMDRNGRVLLFFTTAVNQRTAAGATSVVGGFFWERDLWPRDSLPGFACATSNEGEMFYLPVVDAASRYNAFFANKNSLLAEINATVIHEFQHLINSSHRIYITPEFVEEEEGWLNEGMSHLAEEVLYLRAAGLQSRSDLTFAQSTQPAVRLDHLNNYQLDNLARYNSYLKETETKGAYNDADDLSTRGAAWVLLRWALDHSNGSPETYLRALVSAPTQGIPNFNNVFSGVGGLAAAARGSAVAHYADNLTTSVTPGFSHLTWNFRDWLPRFVSNSGRYPLVTRSLIAGIQQDISLTSGGASYVRFRVNAGVTGAITIAVGGAAPASATELVLVRAP